MNDPESPPQSTRSAWWLTLRRAVATFLVASVVWPIACRRAEVLSDEVKCVNQMVSIGNAAYIFASDNGDVLPTTFFSMSNEVANPIILVCPSKEKPPMDTPWDPDADYYDYEIIATNRAINTNGRTLFIRCQVHGFLGFAEGEVFDGKRYRRKWPN